MSFVVTVKPSNRQFTVEEGETVLDAAIRQGLTFPYGCRNGVCGACRGKVVSGEISYPGGTPRALNELANIVGQSIFCKAAPCSDLVIEVHEIARSGELPIRKMPARVVKLERLADDVMRVYLKLPDTERMQFLAGQYIDILLPGGRRRSFSLANAPHEDALLELHVRHIEGGEFTGHVFTKMQEKDILRIEGPFGNFYLREDSTRPIICVAGGTGFAPIKALIEHAWREEIKRPVYLYWGARAKEDLYLDALPQSWRSRSGFYYIPVLSEPKPSDDAWTGRIGLVHQAVLDDFSDLAGYDVYVCGPPAMIEAARAGCENLGLPEDQFYFDSFDFAVDAP